MSQFNASTYDIERPSGQCAFTGRTLQPGEIYMAALVEFQPPPAQAGDQSSAARAKAPVAKSLAAGLGLKRLDISLQAWEQNQRPPQMFSYWRSTIPQPNQKKKLFVDDDVLVNLFRRLADATQPERLAFRFVLGLILMRKKMLRYDGAARRTVNQSVTQPDGSIQMQELVQEWWTFTPKLDVSKGPLGKWNEQERLEMLNPQLDEAQIAQVHQQLNEILQAEL